MVDFLGALASDERLPKDCGRSVLAWLISSRLGQNGLCSRCDDILCDNNF